MAGFGNYPGMAKNVSTRAKCPLQPGMPCNLCNPDAYNGPQDCPLVSIVIDNPDLKELMNEHRVNHRKN